MKLKTNKETYYAFLEELHNYQNSQDVDSVIARMKDVLRGYPHLLRGVNEFFPAGKRLSLAEITQYVRISGPLRDPR